MPDPDQPRYVLIDCGIHSSQTGRSDLIRQVIKDVRDATGGYLHLVIATHEHYDHLMGFVDSKAGFENFTVDRVWLAWTEDLTDSRALELNKRKQALQEALGLALQRLQLAGASDPQQEAAARRLERWLKWDDAQPLAATADEVKLSTCERAIRLLEKQFNAELEYLEPGEFKDVSDDVPSVRAYVLGPPKGDEHLKKSDPGTKQWGTYLDSDEDVIGLATAVIGAVGDEEQKQTLLQRLASQMGLPAADESGSLLSESADMIDDLAQPFDRRYRIPIDRARTNPFFWNRFFATDQDWRRVNAGWTAAAEQLALHINRHTNNTSLALAFECGPPGKGFVLLFPGDAQLGNWRSWKSQTWAVDNETVTAADLLARTWLYKVGHHASHNGSVSKDDDGQDFGVALFPNDVVSFVPVAEATAHGLGWHDMPFGPILDDLQGGRRACLRADKTPPESITAARTRTIGTGIAQVEFRVAETTRKLVKKDTVMDEGPIFYDLVFTHGTSE